MAHQSSLTVVITAYNEEKTLAKTFYNIQKTLQGVISDYEIIIINDASRDNSGSIADELARKNLNTRAVHNPVNLNQGGCYKKSIELATKKYHCLLPGDDMVEQESLRNLFQSVGKADLSLIFISNYEVRHSLRRFISQCFVKILNLLFGLKLRYYNGPIVARAELLKNLKLSGSFAFIAETIIPLLKKGYGYVVVPMSFTKDKKGANLRAVKRNFFPVIKTIIDLFWRIQVKHQF